MLRVELNEADGIAVLTPNGKLTGADFIAAAAVIDPYIEKSGSLNGIILYVESFPGWDSFSALVSHLSFVKDHHKKLTHVAFVTDMPIAGFAEQIAKHFISARIKHFEFAEFDQAKIWMLARS